MGASDRIVFIHPSDERYGADRILLDLFDALEPEERARAEFWLPTDLPHRELPLCAELEARGAHVRHVDLPILRRAYRRPVALARLVRRALRTAVLLQKARPDMLYLTSSACYLMAPVARLLRIRRVVGHKQEMWSRADSVVLGACAGACHRLIAISGPVLHNLPERLQRRTTLVVNATPEPDSFHPIGDRRGPISYLVASRWNSWKGHRTLLAAWDRVDEPGRLVVLGGPPPAGEAVDVPALVARLRHPEWVTIVGEVPDIGPYIKAADVMVVPSDDPEPFGLVAIEAFARARPVIGSGAGGLADIITDGLDGWTFPPGEVDALAGVIASRTRRDLAAAGDAARRTYERRFTSARYAADWRSAVQW